MPLVDSSALSQEPVASQIRHGSFSVLFVVLGSFGLLLLAFCISICVGARAVTVPEIIQSWIHYDVSNPQHVVIQSLRVPRAICAMAVGASMAVSGSLMQASTRNPMASPSILGINAGASLGLAVAMIVLPAASFNLTVLFSFAGAAVATVIVFGIAAVSPAGSTPVRLALVGTAITALLSALAQALAVYFNITQELTFWNAGGVSGVRPAQVALLIPWTLAGIALAFCIARPVSLLSLGEEVAVGLGGKTKLIRCMASVAVLVLTGSSVAIAGPIGFVGLVVPHAVKALVGADYRRIIPCSLLVGALLVLLADIVARLVNPPFETPTGAITALVGVPFFIYLASRRKDRA